VTCAISACVTSFTFAIKCAIDEECKDSFSSTIIENYLNVGTVVAQSSLMDTVNYIKSQLDVFDMFPISSSRRKLNSKLFKSLEKPFMTKDFHKGKEAYSEKWAILIWLLLFSRFSRHLNESVVNEIRGHSALPCIC